MIHEYKLRPYHNPAGVDESKVPQCWRMLYKDEFPLPVRHGKPCRLFIKPMLSPGPDRFGDGVNCTGALPGITYIVPVTL